MAQQRLRLQMSPLRQDRLQIWAQEHPGESALVAHASASDESPAIHHDGSAPVHVSSRMLVILPGCIQASLAKDWRASAALHAALLDEDMLVRRWDDR